MITPRTLANLRTEFKQSLGAKIGVFLILTLLFVSIFAPVLAPHNPTEQNLNKASQPPYGFTSVKSSGGGFVDGEFQTSDETETVTGSLEHPLGTDTLGRDILSRVIYGTRTSMFVGLLATAISSIIGVVIGLTAGYYRGRVDDVLMRSADVMLALPSLVFAIALIGLFGTQAITIPDPFVYFSIVSDRPDSIVLPGTIMIVIGLVNWVWFARVARGEALSIAQKEYVKSATTLGGGDLHILKNHVLPNSITPIMVFATIQVAFVILLESGLSFLGFTGTTLSWGFDIAQGRAHLAVSWWISTIPGIAIMLAVFAVNLIGDWFRDALDPELDRGDTT